MKFGSIWLNNQFSSLRVALRVKCRAESPVSSQPRASEATPWVTDTNGRALCKSKSFNIHILNELCFCSYRATLHLTYIPRVSLRLPWARCLLGFQPEVSHGELHVVRWLAWLPFSFCLCQQACFCSTDFRCSSLHWRQVLHRPGEVHFTKGDGRLAA